MGSARPWFVLAVALVPAGASADNHFADVMGAGSWAGESSIAGVQASFSWVLGHHPPSHPDGTPPLKWSLLGDVSAHFVGTHKDQELTQFTYAAGVRRTLSDGHNVTYLPFVHGMLGGITTHRGPLDGTRLTGILGVGLDYLTKPRIQRPDPGYTVLGARTQFEVVIPFSGGQNPYPRISVGVVVRIKEHFFHRR